MNPPVGRPLYLLSRLAAWATIPVYLIAILGSLWLNARQGLTPESTSFIYASLLGFSSFAVVGSLLVARRPANLVSWIMVAIALFGSVGAATEMYAARLMVATGRPDALATLGGWVATWYGYVNLSLIVIYLPLFFPTGRLLTHRWRWVPLLAGFGLAGYVTLGLLSENFIGISADYVIANPLGRPGMPPPNEHPLANVFLTCIIAGLFGALLSVAVRYIRSGDMERRQLRWFLFVVAFFPLAFVAGDVYGDVIVVFVFVALPAAVGIAILRYRLYDIDIIIRRTLIYSLLSALLAVIYFGSVVVGQGMVERFAGGQSPLVIVVSTLLIAALFSPLRRRVQRFIDRRFYRSKYDAARTLAAFAHSARDEVELEALSAELVRVVDETMQPERIYLWLRKG